MRADRTLSANIHPGGLSGAYSVFGTREIRKALLNDAGLAPLLSSTLTADCAAHRHSMLLQYGAPWMTPEASSRGLTIERLETPLRHRWLLRSARCGLEFISESMA
ncbi:hypothetical protein VTO73DRAFT_6451 [Trametes versicolor]